MIWLTLAELIIPPVIVLVSLFGVLGRGSPSPGGVALFFRVGAVGLLIGGGLWYLIEQTEVFAVRPMIVVNAYRGIIGGSILCLLMAVFGMVLKKRP